MDLQGPKLRLGSFAEGGVTLSRGERIRFDLDTTPGNARRVAIPHPEIIAAVATGHTLLVDDGKMRLTVVDKGEGWLEMEAQTGGRLSDRKGVNVPDVALPLSALTAKDRRDLAFGLELGVDWVALSFVQRAEDLIEARGLIGERALLMAKIEKPSALTGLDEIIALADGIMVARGDLGVELPPEDVPGLQKRIVRLARRAGKPVVVATQMLESMISAPAPTRAEASDVATAVFDGADAVMLSAESAIGKYPVEAVATMDRVAIEVERDPLYEAIIHAQRIDPEATGADAISAAARTVTETLNLAAIICYTASGATSLRAARERPPQPILALTPIPATGRKLAVVWGLHCVQTDDPRDLDDMVAKACRIAYQEGFAVPGQRVIISAGVPLGTPGATNMLRIAYIRGEDTPGGEGAP
jgi:pyruvate kinase